MQHSTTLYNTAHHCTTLHMTAQHCTALLNTAKLEQHCTQLHNIQYDCIPLHNCQKMHKTAKNAQNCKIYHIGKLHNNVKHFTSLQNTAHNYAAIHNSSTHTTTLLNTVHNFTSPHLHQGIYHYFLFPTCNCFLPWTEATIMSSTIFMSAQSGDSVCSVQT